MPAQEALSMARFIALFPILLLVGCTSSTEKPQAPGANGNAEAREIEEALAKLDPADRKLAQAQRDCVVSQEHLGTMGTPVKILVQGQPVFLCCDGCTKKALANPEKTLARAREMKEKNGVTK
jgi:hypothetical protein